MELLTSDNATAWSKAFPVNEAATQVLPHLEAMRAMMAERYIQCLTGPDVGLPFRFFCWGKLVAINPVITRFISPIGGRRESCVLHPFQFTIVNRYSSIMARWMDAKGEIYLRQLSGGAACIFQHGVERLDGNSIFGRPQRFTP